MNAHRPSARRLVLALTLALGTFAAVVGGQEGAPPAPAGPVSVPTPGGKVVSVNPQVHAILYDAWHFAPVRVDGSLVFVSGVVAGARDGKPLDVAGFEAAVRHAFGQVAAGLAAAGSSPAEIVDLTTFHVFGSSLFQGGKREHIEAFRRVKDEFVRPPYPTWTGIGVADLFPDGGLVEIRVVARLPGPGR